MNGPALKSRHTESRHRRCRRQQVGPEPILTTGERALEPSPGYLSTLTASREEKNGEMLKLLF
jgi:hypothetical protein